MILQCLAQLLWNLADISMLKRLIRARLSQTQQKTEITRSAVKCYSKEIFRFHSINMNQTAFQSPLATHRQGAEAWKRISQPVDIEQQLDTGSDNLGRNIGKVIISELNLI